MLVYIIAAVFFLALFIRRQLHLRKFNSFKGPPAWPIFGNYFLLKDPIKSLQIMNDFRDTYGKTVKLYSGHMLSLVTTDTDLLELLMNAPHMINKSNHYIMLFNRWLGDGLLISSGMKWRGRRKILTPAFHYNILEDFIEVFESRGKYLVDNLRKASKDECVNVHKIFSLYTLDVICDTAMGTAVNVQCNPNHKYMEAIKVMLDIAPTRINNPIYRSELTYKYTNLYKAEQEALNIISDFSLGIIEKRRKYLESHPTDEKEVDEFGKRKKMTFMDILLKSSVNGKQLTNEEIREEVDTFLFEGHDTTSAAISFTCYNLSIHPAIQQKVYKEICEVLPKDRHARIEDLQNLKYLEKVIKESLRLYPSVAFHARVVGKDTAFNGTILPKGVMIAVNIYSLHRDPNVFPDPEKFDPERFAPEKQAKRNPYAYVPFSAGHRNCIGQKFAMLELKSAIAKVVKNFELLPAPNYKPLPVSKVTLSSDNGICVKLNPRSKAK